MQMETKKEIKFESFFQKAMKGEKGYEIGCFVNGLCRWRAEDFGDDIISLTILIWNNSEVKLYYDWNKENAKNEQNLLKFIIKNNKKLMFFDGKNEIFAFGFEEDEDRDESIMIFYQHEETGCFIVASSKTLDIRVERYLRNNKVDAMKVFVDQIYSSLIKAPLIESGVDEVE